MRAVDTNVLARLILADDDAQYRTAAALLLEPVWVAETVWLELGWVLGRQLGLERALVGDALMTILMTATVHTTDRDGIRWAIERYRAGADWADVIHLVAARGIADSFATFDRGVASFVGQESLLEIETLR